MLIKIVAILLIVGGTLGLAYGRLNFTKKTESATFGPMSVTIQERQSMPVPSWVAAAAIAGGVLVLLARKRGYQS